MEAAIKQSHQQQDSFRRVSVGVQVRGWRACPHSRRHTSTRNSISIYSGEWRGKKAHNAPERQLAPCLKNLKPLSVCVRLVMFASNFSLCGCMAVWTHTSLLVCSPNEHAPRVYAFWPSPVLISKKMHLHKRPLASEMAFALAQRFPCLRSAQRAREL